MIKTIGNMLAHSLLLFSLYFCHLSFKRCRNETVHHFMWTFIQQNSFCFPKNLSNPIGILNKVLFWLVLGLFRLLLGCSWLVVRLFRLFLACSWVVPVVLGLFWGVPSFSNDDLKRQYRKLCNI